MAHGFEHAAHLAVAAFGNRHPVPAVGAFTATGFNRAELRHAVVQRHAVEQAFFLFVAQGTQHPHGVFTLQAEARVHQLVGQFAGTCQEQQSFGVQVQPSDRLPFALKQLGQAPEDGRTVLRVIVRHHFAGGLVVGDDAGRRWINLYADGFAVDLDGVAKLDALTDMRRLGIDGNPPFQNQLLHLQTRTQAGLGQHLVQLGRFWLGQQNPLGQVDRGVVFVGIELTGDHVFEAKGRRQWFRALPPRTRLRRCCLVTGCVCY